MPTRRTRVKICGITDPAHGAAAAQFGADAIGVVFWRGTPRFVDHARAHAIAAALPPFVTLVGLFVDPTADELRAALEAVPIDLLQFHGDEPPDFCRAFGRPYLKAIAVTPETGSRGLLEYAVRYPDARGLLLDAPPSQGMPGGTGQSFDWSLVPRTLPRPLVLSGGLDAGNVRAAIERVRPDAVDVSSGVEARSADGRPIKGVKDPQRILAFIEEVRRASHP